MSLLQRSGFPSEGGSHLESSTRNAIRATAARLPAQALAWMSGRAVPCAPPPRWYRRVLASAALAAFFLPITPLRAQTLFNVDFGVTAGSVKVGFAASGMSTNDYWNLYQHYEPKFIPGMPLVPNGRLEKLRLADGTESPVSISVTNAPGVWGNSSGDPMYDTYMFAQDGSNITVTVNGLTPGRYHFYLYGHADADVTGEQNSVFTLTTGTNVLGPVTQLGGNGWKSGNPWQERAQYVVFRDVCVEAGPVQITVAPGPNGVAVLNGLQILSRGTSPPRLLLPAAPGALAASTNLLFREIRYEGTVSDSEARFSTTLQVESLTTNEISAPLFEGAVALVAPELPEGLRIVSQGLLTRLFCASPGAHAIRLQVVARINRVEPWNQVSFTGPAAAIATVSATAGGEGVEMQMLSGTQVSKTPPGNTTGGGMVLKGLLGADGKLALRWQSKTAEVSRKSLVTADTTVNVQITPAVIKLNTVLRYEILQASMARVKIELPANQALTRIQGDQIRDWQVTPEGNRQLLAVEFIKPLERACTLTLFSEQPLETTPTLVSLVPPQPMEVEREAGSLTLGADDMSVEVDSATGLRQVNASAGALAAYRFSSRPIALSTRLQRIAPVLQVSDRITARLEETRVVVTHALNLSVQKAGIYGLDLTPQPAFVVTDVKGDGIEDWTAANGQLKVSFSSRVLGSRKIDIQLEQAAREFRDRLTILPLQLAAATNVTVQLGAGASPGIRLKTAQLTNLREMPITSLANRADETLAFVSEQPDWQLSLAVERLSARVVAEVFNLATIGEGAVGGSATIRYGILNQGVQEFQLALPPHWKNVEFTGANIRRKEQQTNVWTLTLQDKVWGGYTLVITYDYQFDPKGSTLDLAGAHALGVERETGSLGLMTAANLKLTPAVPNDPLRRVDEAELSESDRALCTRPLLLAYKYSSPGYQHSVQVTRFDELPVLDAVADRTELTTVLTEEGQLLTQSSFMVKNNEKQFQRFKLPQNSEFWSSYVNGQPAKPEKDGDWLLVPLPRDANRDQAFAVDIVFAQKIDLKTWLFPRRIVLAAPLTDIPNTYAEWQLFAPNSHRLSRFDGNMTVARGTTYELRDAWERFVEFYGTLIERSLGAIIFFFVLGVIALLIVTAARRGVGSAVSVLIVFAILAILAAMMLPALSRAKSRAQRISAVNNLKQIGLAAKTWALDNGDALPSTFEDMKNELGTDKVTIDPNTGQRFIYVGAGKNDATPEAILAYSPSDVNGRAVLFADGSVQVLTPEKFEEAMQRDAALPRVATAANAPAQAPPPPPTQQAAQPAAPPPATPVTAVPSQPSSGGPSPALMPQVRPTATGVRPIRIEVPRTGRAFNFTKVLNVGQEPPNVSVSIMRMSAWRAVQMLLQVTGFVVGLGMLWWQSAASRRKALWMALAVMLIAWSVANLLIMWRLLHFGFIAAVPALLLVVISSLAWKFAPRRHAPALPYPAPVPEAGTGTPPGPAAAAVLVLSAILAASAPARADQPAPAADSNAVSIVSASYEGTVSDKVAQFNVTLSISAAATNQIVPLFSDEIAVEAFSAEGDARLVREGRTLAVLLSRRGPVRLQARLIVKTGGEVTRRQVSFAIPLALSSRVTATIEETDADVEMPTAVAFHRSDSNQTTRVEAILGATDRFELNWTPRVKRAAEIAATVFVQNTALVTIGSGVINSRATLDYQISQGELRQVRVQIPAGHRLLRVEGESIRTWDMNADALTVNLVKGVSPGYKLTLETEKVLDKLPATARLEIPHALDTKRETGLVAVRPGDELSLVIDETRELQRVDAEEFYRASNEKRDGIVGAFRFLKTDFLLSMRADAVQAQIEALTRNQVRISSDSVRLRAQIDYTIKRAGIFALRLALPAGYRLENVAGTNIAQWAERTDAGARTLEVTLKERTMGAYTLETFLALTHKEPPKNLPVLGVHPLDTAKLNGFITVSTEQGIGAKTEQFDGLTEIPFASVPGAANRASAQAASFDNSPPITASAALAYKFIATGPAAQSPWKLSVATETIEPWVRAEVLNTFVLTETLVSGRSVIKYDIANGPLKELQLRVPAEFKNVEISGAQIRRRDETNGEWRVELQSKVRGEYLLAVTWELSRSDKTNLLELTGVQALGVEREVGYVAVVCRPPLQVTDRSAGNILTKIDVRELPAWTGQADPATALAYRYPRPGYKLTLEARRFSAAEVLQALIDNARLTTVVADDGQSMTELALSIRNNGRQHLEIELPANATVWSAFVAGEPVRPSRREGKLLLPLAREVASEAPINVELTFISREQFPKHRGAVALASPRFDMPLKNARWDVYLPPDYEYTRFQGSMNRISDALTPVEQVYSLSEYNVQQRAQEEQQRMELRYGLKAARDNLSGGNLRQAVTSFKRSKVKGQQLSQSAAEDRDLKQVEQELRRAQGSNLIDAQNRYVIDNNARLGDQQAVQLAGQQPAQQQLAQRAEPAANLFLNYDVDVAAQQWDKLEKAQQVAVAKVSPLRVNLPTRGVRHTFSQVLQTEIRKPMTVRLVAENTKDPNWFTRAALVVVAFGVLWLVIAWLSQRAARSGASRIG